MYIVYTYIFIRFIFRIITYLVNQFSRDRAITFLFIYHPFIQNEVIGI